MAPELAIRPIRLDDDPEIARIIRTVAEEFGMAGQGFAVSDPEVDHMSSAYAEPRCAYFVLTEGGRVMGGAGIAPLAGGGPDTCELRKMYLLLGARGRGAGRELLGRCLESARAFGFRACYLETLAAMEAAQALYVSAGFAPRDRPLGATGHGGCNRWYELALS